MTQSQSTQQAYNPWYIAITKPTGGRHYSHITTWGSSSYKNFKGRAQEVGIEIVAEEFNVPIVKESDLEILCASLIAGKKLT